MIPILYDHDETQFRSNGLGRIPCTSCHVREQRNGIYECEFKVSVAEEIYPQITEGRIIACIHDDRKDVQPFEIYGRTAPMNGLVTFYAHHLSYRLNKIVVKPFTASTIAETFTKIVPNSVNTNPFTFWTDKSVTANFAVKVPTPVRNMLGGSSGSILDVYGKGEYEFDKWEVKLYTNRGRDNDVTIRYGKNLTDIRQELDASGTYNAVAPYWKSIENNTVVTLPEGYVTNQQLDSYEVKPLDCSTYFDSQPTEAQLRARALQYLNGSDGWVIDENITIDFVPLWQTPEYADIASLERVSLCDKVSVIHPILGVSANKIQVIEVDYDVLLEKYRSMELGKAKSTFVDAIKSEVAEQVVAQVPSLDTMAEAIAEATDLITGATGGNVVINRDANGKPYEILIMDKYSTAEAVNVWRFNSGGLGHSHSGYSGPYNDIALTANGKINANMITVGTLDANIIRAGIIADTAGKNSWNLETGVLTTILGQIGNWQISEDGLYKEFTIGTEKYRVFLTAPTSLTEYFISLQKWRNNAWYVQAGLSYTNGLVFYSTSSWLPLAQVNNNGLYVYGSSGYPRVSVDQNYFKFYSIIDGTNTPIFSINGQRVIIRNTGEDAEELEIDDSMITFFKNSYGKAIYAKDYFGLYQDNGGPIIFAVLPNVIDPAVVCNLPLVTYSGQNLGADDTPWSAVIAKSIELWGEGDVSTPFIDTHFAGSQSDYTGRIIESSSGHFTVYNSITGPSDARLKENIADLTEAEKRLIMSLRAKTFNFKNTDVKHAGLIAQEVIEAEKEQGIEESCLIRGTGEEIPDPKHPDKTTIDYYSVDYDSLTALLLSQVQDLTKQVAELTAQVEALKGGRT